MPRQPKILLTAVLVVLMLLAGCGGGDEGSATTTSSAEPSPTSAPANGETTTTAASAVKSGADLFSVFCAGCHGADGKAKFAPVIVDTDEDRMMEVVTEGTGTMEGYGGALSPEEIQAVVDYAVSLE